MQIACTHGTHWLSRQGAWILSMWTPKHSLVRRWAKPMSKARTSEGGEKSLSTRTCLEGFVCMDPRPSFAKRGDTKRTRKKDALRQCNRMVCRKLAASEEDGWVCLAYSAMEPAVFSVVHRFK